MDAKQIIELFGGQSALAKEIGKGQSTVAYWAKAGVIPAKWQQTLLELAATRGVPLQANDFMGGVDSPGPLITVRMTSGAVARVSPSPLLPEVQPDGSPFLFYTADDGTVKVQVLVGEETIWASQKGMGEIFDVESNTIGYHLKEIFGSGELDELSVTRKFRATAADGKSYETNFYSLDAVISVGYRVNSLQATQFRKWATGVLKSYLIKGFALDDDRLKQGKQLFGQDYFEELLERIREIRASERRFYQKITDLYAQCSVDYDPDSPITQRFYAHIQDKLHYAIHGHTSAELIGLRADASQPHMGLTSWKNAEKGGKVTKLDVRVGKNYLTQDELQELNRLVAMYLDFAENFARRHKLMTMKDWIEKIDDFLQFNAYNVLNSYGRITREAAERHAYSEYEKFRLVQDVEYRSDFDKVVEAAKVRKLPKESEPA